MARGRRAEPAAVKEAKGNPGKRPMPADRADDEAPRLGGAPGHLDDKEAAVWRALVPSLVQLRFVKDTDRGALERYCHWTIQFWDAVARIKDGEDAVYKTSSPHIENMLRQNPWFGVKVRAEKMLQDLEDRIGLNPTARQRILLARAAGYSDPMVADALKESDGDGSPIGMLGGTVH